MNTVDAITAQIEAMPTNEIAPIAEQAMGGSVERDLSWQAQQMDVLSVGNGTVGFWRVSGTSASGTDSTDWSAVVKVLDVEDLSSSPTFQTAQREIDALGADELRSIDTGLRPVPVFRLEQREDGNFWLWMKDLSGAPQPPWDAEQHIESARHIGQFNGLWSEDHRPEGDWIAADMSTDGRYGLTEMFIPDFELLESNKNHPLVNRASEEIGLERTLALLDDTNLLIEATRTLPRSVAHNDCHARNLFPFEERGKRITYGVDWASIGMAPVGVDGGSLAGGGFTWGQDEAKTALGCQEEMFESYVEGLRDYGWNGNESEVRLAYLSQVATYVLRLPFWLAVTIAPEHPFKEFMTRRTGTQGEEAAEQIAHRLKMSIHLVDEALELAR